MSGLLDMIRGRCIDLVKAQNGRLSITLAHQNGTVTLEAKSDQPVGLGDILEIHDGNASILTPNRTHARSTHWLRRILDPRRTRNLKIRSQVESGIRRFFQSEDFLEVRTPLLVPSPGMEPHIRPFRVEPLAAKEGPHGPKFLPTSPEFAMKRLLTGGLERIFQLSPAFRDEPLSDTHHPEFTMLEWYRAYAGYERIMEDTERLFAAIATELNGKAVIRYQGKEIDVAPPWPRLTVRELFLDHCGIDLVRCSKVEELAEACEKLGLRANPDKETWDDIYFKIWLTLIEPELPENRAVFVTRYPASQAALAVIDHDPDGSRWARRFEAYAGGLELGNAFEELTDPEEQRARFAHDMELRAKLYGSRFPKSPIDEGFLGALEEGMPPSGGIAMGVDRMVMLFADESDIRYTLWLDQSALPPSNIT